MDTDTIKASKKFYNTTLSSDTVFAKADASTSDENFEKLTRESNIRYRSCIVSLIYLLSTRVDFIFAVHKLESILSNPGKVHFEGLVHILRYIMVNNTLGLNYYATINNSPVSDLLRRARIKIENHLMNFTDSSWQDCSDNVRSTGS